MKLCSVYKNGNYVVSIFDDGTKIRKTMEDEFIPSFAENCDMKITDKCDQGCPFCYEGCTKSGKHGDLFKYDFINHLHPGTELALNGNDLDHPQLEEFLNHLKTQKIFANITVHQNQFMKNLEYLKKLQDDKLIYGIGVSLNNANEELINGINTLKNVVIHTIVGVLSESDIDKLKNNGLKILILGYKELQRGVSYLKNNEDMINTNKKYLYDNLEQMKKWFKVMSFDNLAITQLDVKRIVPADKWDEFYMGDDGGYTFYIDMVKGEFSKNSIATDRYPIGTKSIDEMFNYIKSIA